jgi:hypothetical protein
MRSASWFEVQGARVEALLEKSGLHLIRCVVDATLLIGSLEEQDGNISLVRGEAPLKTQVTEDRMIPPAAQTTMAERMGSTVADTPGSHAIYVSRPGVVADLIRTAATTVEA